MLHFETTHGRLSGFFAYQASDAVVSTVRCCSLFRKSKRGDRHRTADSIRHKVIKKTARSPYMKRSGCSVVL